MSDHSRDYKQEQGQRTAASKEESQKVEKASVAAQVDWRRRKVTCQIAVVTIKRGQI